MGEMGGEGMRSERRGDERRGKRRRRGAERRREEGSGGGFKRWAGKTRDGWVVVLR